MTKPASATNTGGLLTNQRKDRFMANADLTAEKLRTFVSYNPDTGIFTRVKSKYKNAILNVPLGRKNKSGYLVASLDGKVCYLHRAAWLYVHGEWPKHHIDHIDGNRANNAIANLRDVPAKINMQNVRHVRKHNKLGALGVSQTPTGKFVTRVVLDGKRFFKTFNTQAEAQEAYIFLKRFFHQGNTI